MTKEQKDFLKTLQHELKTQPNDYNADPVFWVIAQYVYEPTSDDYADDTHYFDGEYSYESFDQVLNSIKNNGYFNKRGRFTGELDEYEDDFYLKDITCHGDLPQVLQLEYQEIPVKKVHKIMRDTFFITKTDAKEHLKLNYYHYNETAHTYAMTAWRSPSVEKLWKLLKEIELDD